MICQNCNENEANVKYTQIINGVKKQMNLCDKCAKDLGIDNISFDMQMNFSNFFNDFFEDINDEFIPSLIKPQTLLCDKCGNSYEDFIKSGKFGCDKCYDTFQNRIDAILKNIHGTNKHIGRNVKQIEENIEENNKIKSNNKKDEKEKINTNKDKLNKLEERLKQEIKEERYEDAAKTRDELKKLK